ncbi:MAG: putative aminohydrolase SsnA [Oscillospiraceae bacterium]
MLLIGNGKVLTRNEEEPYFENGAVVTEGETIKEAGDFGELRRKYPQAEFVDARGGIIMPGFINAHTHIYSALARGLSIKGYSPANFLEILEGMWWNIDRHLDLESVRASARATVMDCIRQGVTAIFDHHASYCQIRGSLFAIGEVTREMGLRACLCYEVSDRDGEEKCLEGIRENVEFIRYARELSGDMLKGMFGIHALFTVSDRTLERCVEANNGMAGFHLHVSEGLNDLNYTLQKYGKRPVYRLRDWGILGDRTILAHCIHVNSAEMDLIRATNTMVVNNPQSNMGNAVGCSPVLQMFEKGILVGLGTDAYTHDMLESAKAALAIQRHNAGLPNVAWREVTEMLFYNNARIAARFFDKPLGILKPGAAADVIVMDYRPYTPFSHENADGHMLFGMSGSQCRTTVVNGRVLMKDGEFTSIDEEKIKADIRLTAGKLWKSLGG